MQQVQSFFDAKYSWFREVLLTIHVQHQTFYGYSKGKIIGYFLQHNVITARQVSCKAYVSSLQVGFTC